MRKPIGLLAALAAVATLSACASAQRPTVPVEHTMLSRPPSSVLSAQPTVATDADNGHTVTIPVGQQLQVRLGSTYWQFDADTSGPALRMVGAPTTNPTGGCPPGTGCGTVTALFQADSPGRAAVTALRNSCGEARRCTAGQRAYRLSVLITP